MKTLRLAIGYALSRFATFVAGMRPVTKEDIAIARRLETEGKHVEFRHMEAGIAPSDARRLVETLLTELSKPGDGPVTIPKPVASSALGFVLAYGSMMEERAGHGEKKPQAH